ncbi:MAG: hypothetical protein JSV16_01565 [Candidatus Hydrogenedentota bacterium]|nr:MAG: hypothetical protein JSV16_01565 [Candidatus Hydrogenedentota bacterium]
MPLRTQQIKAALWGIDLLLAAAAVFFLVKAIQHMFISPILGGMIPEPLVDSSPSRVVASYSKVRPYGEYASLRNSNLFGALSSSNVAAQKVVKENLPETTLELELLGCVSADVPELGFAIVRDKKTRTEDTYALGDFIVADARLEEIRESEVVISRAGGREILAMSFSDVSPFDTSPRPFASSRHPGFPGPGRTSRASDRAIRVVNENLRYINRQKFMQEVGENPTRLLDQFRATPNIVDGKPTGIRVDGVGSDPILNQSGLQPGDVVKSVNGIRTNSFDEVFGLAERLQNAPEIRVVVERDGRHRTLVYKIR